MPQCVELVIISLLLSVSRPVVLGAVGRLGTRLRVDEIQPDVDTVTLVGQYSSRGEVYSIREADDGNETRSDNNTVYEWSCESVSSNPLGYNQSGCAFVHEYCTDLAHLFDYLSFIMCDLENVKPIGYIILAIWCIYVISLLATTVDNFFVPPLIYLAEKTKLSPSIAGITLLALGNGAPDIFCVYSGLSQGDLALVLGSLAGGAMFITTVIVGTIIFFSKKGASNVDKIDFIRDIVALMVVISAVVLVAYDGVIYLVESQWKKRSAKLEEKAVGEEKMLREETLSASFSLEQSLPLRMISKSVEVSHRGTSESKPLSGKTAAPQSVELPGLTWPAGNHIIVKIIWAIQWPFSLLRWLTIPPFCPPDIAWTKWHYLFAVVSPMFMVLITLIAAEGWTGLLITFGVVPLPAILLAVGIGISLLMAILLRPNKPPHWAMMVVLVTLAFIMSIVWLHILANEVVSVLSSLGLLLNIDTGILGLTVLALGNCMADWVADSVVARSGNLQMAFAACFGSPMLSHVLGLSVAFMVQILWTNRGEPYVFDLSLLKYNVVKLAWIFIGLSLISTLIVFPIFKFSPPKAYAIVLFVIYIVFVVLAVLCAIGVIPFLL